jgi:copper(I)-binding protein
MVIFQVNETNMLNISYKHLSHFVLTLVLALSYAQVKAKELVYSKELVSVTDAWVRPTNPGQEVGAAYMTLLSKQEMTLVSIESNVTNSVEIHNMTMENGVMKMRMLEKLPLMVGKPFKLAPGGFHLMMFDLKKPLIVGEQVNFILHFKTSNKKTMKTYEFNQTIKAMVQAPPESTTH